MATKTSGNNKIYLIAGAIVLGVGAYFGYNWWKKRKDANPETPIVDPIVPPADNNVV